MSLQSSQERQFDDFALVGRFDHTRFRAVLRQRPMQAVTMIIAHIVGGNRERPARMAEQLFWRVREHLKEQTPGFAAGKRRGPAFRFKMPIHVIDSTTMELVANCLDWAKHRRRKAAAKTHMRLNLQSFLPSFVIVDTVAEHDNKRARELCADLKSGEIVLFDKGYVDFGHLRDLDERGVFWVTRAKENMVYEVVRKMPTSKDAKILRDEVIVLRNENKPAPELMRRGGGATIGSRISSAPAFLLSAASPIVPGQLHHPQWPRGHCVAGAGVPARSVLAASDGARLGP